MKTINGNESHEKQQQKLSSPTREQRQPQHLTRRTAATGQPHKVLTVTWHKEGYRLEAYPETKRNCSQTLFIQKDSI